MYSFCFFYYVSPGQLLAAATPKLKVKWNKLSVYTVHHECSRGFKNSPLDHSNQIMYITRFLKINDYRSFEQ